MMKNPKVFHLGDEINRKKIYYFIDKYVTRLYGSRHIQLWATKNQNRTIIDLIKCQIWCTQLLSLKIAIKSGNSVMREEMYPPRLEERDGKETKKNCQLRRPPSSQRDLGKRENATRWDEIMRGYISSTRFATNGRN